MEKLNVIDIQKYLDWWTSLIPQRGSTWVKWNQLGDEYIMIEVRADRGNFLRKLADFRHLILKEAVKTGMLSIRWKPNVVLVNDYEFILRTRIVSYRGNLYDSIIPPEEWHKRH